MEIVRPEGSRAVARDVEFYNLDAIIAVGYRVNSYQATQFRIWATKTLREFIIEGFVMDDERLKRGKILKSDVTVALAGQAGEKGADRGRDVGKTCVKPRRPRLRQAGARNRPSNLECHRILTAA